MTKHVRSIDRHEFTGFLKTRLTVLHGLFQQAVAHSDTPAELRPNMQIGVKECDRLLTEVQEMLSPPMERAEPINARVRVGKGVRGNDLRTVVLRSLATGTGIACQAASL